MGLKETAILAGGCSGHTGLVRKIPGVASTRRLQRRRRLPMPLYCNHGTHAEALEVVFDPAFISYREVLEFFFQIHDPSTPSLPGNVEPRVLYCSGIYFTTPEQRQIALETIADVDALGPVAGQGGHRSQTRRPLLAG